MGESNVLIRVCLSVHRGRGTYLPADGGGGERGTYLPADWGVTYFPANMGVSTFQQMGGGEVPT